MYFPHLFARQSELLAVRYLAELTNLSQTIVPIWEPAVLNSSALRSCLNVLAEHDVQSVVITNPVAGAFTNQAIVPAWRDTLTQHFQDHEQLMPGFVCRAGTTIAEVNGFLQRYPGRPVSLLYWSPNLTNMQLTTLTDRARVRFHICLHDQMSHVQRSMLPTPKAVDVRDHFNKQTRNADYGAAEFFSDDHLSFEGNAVGFGDYSIVGSHFQAGGGPAHAVAIHGIYKNSETDNIWVEHFVSDDTDAAVGSVESKFLQAAGKLVDQFTERPHEFGNDAALVEFADDVEAEHFPGLGASKRRQIQHHLALISDFLSGTGPE